MLYTSHRRQPKKVAILIPRILEQPISNGFKPVGRRDGIFLTKENMVKTHTGKKWQRMERGLKIHSN